MYNFARKDHAEAAVEAARERLDTAIRTTRARRNSATEQFANFWVTPDGDIPAGTVDVPAKGEAFYLRFDVENETWERSGADSVEIWNIGAAIQEGNTDTDVKFQIYEDAFGVFWVLDAGKPQLTIQAPQGGIPSANEYIFGSVVCKILESSGGEWSDTGRTERIFNPTTETELRDGLRLGWAIWDGSEYVLVSKLCRDTRDFEEPDPFPGANIGGGGIP